MKNTMGLAYELRSLAAVEAEAAMEKIYKIHQGKLLHIAVKILQNTSAAEEVVNDTFVKLWIKRATIKEDQHIEGFLIVVLRNACINAGKKLYREKQIPDNAHKVVEQAAALSYLQELDKSNRILAIVETMPRQTGEVFRLHYFQEKTNEEIAEELRISADTVKAQLSRGRKFIKDKLSGSSDRDDILMLLFFCFVSGPYSA